MGTIYGSKAFRRHVQWQIDCAEVFLAVHAEAGLGLCRCGRLHPCDERRYWLRMRAHYGRLLDEVVPQSDTAIVPAEPDRERPSQPS